MNLFDKTPIPVRSLEELPPGKLYAVIRPLKSNVPTFPGAELTTCPQCGWECWKTPNEPAVLPSHIVPRCSECAQRVHLEKRSDRNGRA